MKDKSIVQLMDIYVAAFKSDKSIREVDEEFLRRGVTVSDLKEVKKSIKSLGLLVDEVPVDTVGKGIFLMNQWYSKALLFSFVFTTILAILDMLNVFQIHNGVSFSFPTITGGILFARHARSRSRGRRRFD